MKEYQGQKEKEECSCLFLDPSPIADSPIDDTSIALSPGLSATMSPDKHETRHGLGSQTKGEEIDHCFLFFSPLLALSPP